MSEENSGWAIVGKGAAGVIVASALAGGGKLVYDQIYAAGEFNGMRNQEKVLATDGRLLPEAGCIRYDQSSRNKDGNPIVRLYGVEGCTGTEFRYVVLPKGTDKSPSIGAQTLMVGENSASFYTEEAHFAAPSYQASLDVTTQKENNAAVMTFNDSRLTFMPGGSYNSGSYKSGWDVTIDTKVANEWETKSKTFQERK